MKKAILILGFSGLGVAAFMYFRKQIKLLQEYQYKIVGIRVKRLAKDEISFDIKTRFISKSALEAKITKLYLDVFVEGVNAGYISENKEIIVPAKGFSDIDLSFNFNPQVVLKNAVTIILAGIGRRDLTLGFKGFASIKSGLVATTLKINYQTTLKDYLNS